MPFFIFYNYTKKTLTMPPVFNQIKNEMRGRKFLPRILRLGLKPIAYLLSSAVTSARTWRRALGTRLAVLETVLDPLEALASYSS